MLTALDDSEITSGSGEPSVRLRGFGMLIEYTLTPSCHLSVRIRGLGPWLRTPCHHRVTCLPVSGDLGRGHLALYTGHRAVQQGCCCDQCQCGLWQQRCQHLSWRLHRVGHLSSAAPAPTAAIFPHPPPCSSQRRRSPPRSCHPHWSLHCLLHSQSPSYPLVAPPSPPPS